MDFDSPDVEKDFPGLYASESGANKKKEESDFSEGDHEKLSKKELLIGRRKDKKEKKDLRYATLQGSESSPEEELETKSPSKSTKKSKAFKFTSSKSKEKREKSREKSDKDLKEKDVSESKEKEKDKKKDKEKRDKEKKDKTKDKDKDKKDKKSKQASICEEVLELGDVQPVFGVSVSLATERSHCHDGIDLPLVVRDCIDFLQENGLQNDQIYKVEPMKSRLQSFKRLYNNRETQSTEEFEVSIACGLLKLFLRELPEPILTTDLITRFEEAASHNEVTQTEAELKHLLDQLPSCNKTLLSWILLHFDSVIQNEKYNKLNAQSLAMLLSPPLQMSHRLLVTLLCHCPNLFPDVKLVKYVPPITSTSPKLPEDPHQIQIELKKQESLLTQIHSEMNAGFFSKKREEQLWEVQRIITQLKRKLRSFEKRQDTLESGNSAAGNNTTETPITTGPTTTWSEDDYSLKSFNIEGETKLSPQDIPEVIPEQQIIESVGDLLDDPNNPDKLYVHESGLLMVPESHPSYAALLKLQLENQELLQWKSQLQSRINSERAELLKLKKLLSNVEQNQLQTSRNTYWNEDGDYERVIERYIKENNLLEQKKQMLAQEIFEEHRALIQLKVDIGVQAFKA
ncbi:ralA-binding protein 1 [Condylostylus longicornis]|uniref:ralA-binding protein 1 n=1 Tax=Condylostylus longicornis TaxID=2530218 RepID=UPI00244E037A|nr:ralA-binding protein 1 [Condylostylus longicornis]